MNILQIIFGIFGGLAIFLYGVHLLSSNIQRVAGEKLRKLLEKLTNNRLKAAGVGALTTAIVQSSSLTIVTLIGLINAGLLSLEQGIGVMLGAEIGTTLTAQIIAFEIGSFYLPIIAIGFFLTFFTKKRKWKYIGQTILGFGLIFLGMATMSAGVSPLKTEPFFINLLTSFGKTPFFGVIAGAIFTALVQSSSATTGLVIAMGIENVITLPAAIALIFGANIGTCITGQIASIGSNLSSKRLTMAQLLINIIGVSLFFIFLSPFARLISLTSMNLPRQIANAHMFFNIAVTLIMLPFVGILVFIVKKIIRGEEIKVERGVKFLDERTLNMPAIAIKQAEKEIERMGNIALSALKDSIKAFRTNNTKLIEIVDRKENLVDELDDAIEIYLTKITQKELSKSQSKRVAALIHAISDIERVSDHAHNISEMAQRKITEKLRFSKKAMEELNELFDKTKESFVKAMVVLIKKDKKMTKKVFELETEIDVLTEQFEYNDSQRLKTRKCNPRASVIFVSLLRSLERISDHANNIARSTTMGF